MGSRAENVTRFDTEPFTELLEEESRSNSKRNTVQQAWEDFGMEITNSTCHSFEGIRAHPKIISEFLILH
jgi:hypothetical protein